MGRCVGVRGTAKGGNARKYAVCAPATRCGISEREQGAQAKGVREQAARGKNPVGSRPSATDSAPPGFRKSKEKLSVSRSRVFRIATENSPFPEGLLFNSKTRDFRARFSGRQQKNRPAAEDRFRDSNRKFCAALRTSLFKRQQKTPACERAGVGVRGAAYSVGYFSFLTWKRSTAKLLILTSSCSPRARMESLYSSSLSIQRIVSVI